MLVRVVLGASEPQIAIFDGESVMAVVDRVKSEIEVADDQRWEPNPYDPHGSSFLLFDPSLHGSVEEAADDEHTTYLSAAPVELGVFWDPDLI